MRRDGGEVILTVEEYDQIQEALRKRTAQMKGQLPPVTPPTTQDTEKSVLPPAKYYCPTCQNFRGSANKMGIGYVGDCMHRVWNLSELNDLSARRQIIQELGDLKAQYEVAILNVRQANDLLEDQRGRDHRIAGLNSEVASLRQQIELLSGVNAALQQEIRNLTTGPERAGRSINL